MNVIHFQEVAGTIPNHFWLDVIRTGCVETSNEDTVLEVKLSSWFRG